MLKRMTLLARRRGLDDAAFRAHWRGPHAALAAALPGLVRYRQNHILDRQQRVGAAPAKLRLDGIPELWFADEAAMAEAMRGPEAAALLADEPRFLDGVTILVVEERVVVDTPPRAGPGVKRMAVLQRRADLDVGRFRRHWHEVHGPLAAALPGVRRYVQNHVLSCGHRTSLALGPQAVDGVVEFWFDDVAAMDAAFASPDGRAAAADIPLFLAAVSTYLVDEVTIVAG